MAGRKRKPGQREPNGRLDRKSSEASYSPAAVKRMTDAAVAAAHDPRLGTVLGRLMLQGDINARQAGAIFSSASFPPARTTAPARSPSHQFRRPRTPSRAGPMYRLVQNNADFM